MSTTISSPSGTPGGPGGIERFTAMVTRWVGSVYAFALAVLAVILWAFSGPFFHYSDSWQLVINTSTTIVTFLMVFLIQRAQNKDTLAVQLKLNEVVAALKGASNRLIDVENLSEEEVQQLHARYQQLAVRAQEAGEITASHTVEEHCEEVTTVSADGTVESVQSCTVEKKPVGTVLPTDEKVITTVQVRQEKKQQRC